MAITINGDGTLTGISVGGLPDGIVDTDMLADNAVTSAKYAISTAKVYDAKSSGTNGGTFTSGSDQTRDLNQKEDPDSIVTLSSNQFTLEAGTYLIQWTCPAYRVSRHQSHLYDVTNTAILARGQSSQASNANDGESLSSGSYIATITSNTAYEIRHRCSSTVTSNGFGHQCGFGTEIYTVVNIFKLS